MPRCCALHIMALYKFCSPCFASPAPLTDFWWCGEAARPGGQPRANSQPPHAVLAGRPKHSTNRSLLQVPDWESGVYPLQPPHSRSLHQFSADFSTKKTPRPKIGNLVTRSPHKNLVPLGRDPKRARCYKPKTNN